MRTTEKISFFVIFLNQFFYIQSFNKETKKLSFDSIEKQYLLNVDFNVVKKAITTVPNKNHSRKSWVYVKICL